MVRRAHKRKHKKDDKGLAKLLVGGFLGLLMVGSVFGIVSTYIGGPTPAAQSNEPINVAGFEYVVEQDPASGNVFFTTQVDGQAYTFYILPTQLEVPLENQAGIVALLGPKSGVLPSTSVSFNPTANQTAAQDFVKAALDYDAFVQQSPIVHGVTQADSLQPDARIVTCADAADGSPVVVLQYGAEKSLVIENNCMTATGVSQRDIIAYGELIRQVRAGVIG